MQGTVLHLFDGILVMALTVILLHLHIHGVLQVITMYLLFPINRTGALIPLQ